MKKIFYISILIAFVCIAQKSDAQPYKTVFNPYTNAFDYVQESSGVSESRQIIAGIGLEGGGDLSADRTIDISNTTVTPGDYTSANISVNAQGQITAATNGAGGGDMYTSVYDPNGDACQIACEAFQVNVTSPITGGGTLALPSMTIGMATSGVTPGSYTSADITVDSFGRVTAATANVLIADGTATQNTLFWNGSAWVENTVLRVDAPSNAIGINIDPTRTLHIYTTGTTAFRAEKNDGAAFNLELANTDRTWNFGLNSAEAFVVRDVTGGANVLTFLAGTPASSIVVDTDGDVGFGVSNPLNKLDFISTAGPQMRSRYSGSVYSTFETDSTGILEIRTTGSNIISGKNLIIGRGLFNIDYTLSFNGFNDDATFTWVEDQSRLDLDRTFDFQDEYISSYISPAALSADQDDWNPTGLASARIIRIDTTTNVDINGIAKQANKKIHLINISTNNIRLLHEQLTSTTVNRFALPGTLTLTENDSCIIWHDPIANRWRLMGTTS